MENLRKHGRPPYRTAILHGGPGVRKEVGAVARHLSASRGILEPLETKTTIDGQVEEFRKLFDENASCPLTLVGYSWGAWLALVIASRYPEKIAKVILVASGGFRKIDGKITKENRLNRLSADKRKEAGLLEEILAGKGAGNPDEALSRLGALYSSVDNFNPLEDKDEVEVVNEIHEGLWGEGKVLRENGKLMEIISGVKCPVVAIQGDHDPHPVEGVRGPLEEVLKDFRFILLEKCGHKPWIEKEARERFYAVLDSELG
jgi:pimeloyl-ACP methyl ester carboxylesterase